MLELQVNNSLNDMIVYLHIWNTKFVYGWLYMKNENKLAAYICDLKRWTRLALPGDI